MNFLDKKYIQTHCVPHKRCKKLISPLNGAVFLFSVSFSLISCGAKTSANTNRTSSSPGEEQARLETPNEKLNSAENESSSTKMSKTESVKEDLNGYLSYDEVEAMPSEAYKITEKTKCFKAPFVQPGFYDYIDKDTLVWINRNQPNYYLTAPDGVRYVSVNVVDKNLRCYVVAQRKLFANLPELPKFRPYTTNCIFDVFYESGETMRLSITSLAVNEKDSELRFSLDYGAGLKLSLTDSTGAEIKSEVLAYGGGLRFVSQNMLPVGAKFTLANVSGLYVFAQKYAFLPQVYVAVENAPLAVGKSPKMQLVIDRKEQSLPPLTSSEGACETP